MTASHQSNAQTVATQTVGLRKEVGPYGTVFTIEKRGDELWINGKKVILCRADCQKKDVPAYFLEILRELAGKQTLTFEVFNFLLKNTEFLPDSWKQQEGKWKLPVKIAFLETLDEQMMPFVLYIYWHEGNNRWETGKVHTDEKYGDYIALLE